MDNSIEDGYVCGNNWFDSSCQEDFLEFLSGSDDEKSAISTILDNIFSFLSDVLAMTAFIE